MPPERESQLATATGFAGLSALVSDVDGLVRDVAASCGPDRPRTHVAAQGEPAGGVLQESRNETLSRGGWPIQSKLVVGGFLLLVIVAMAVGSRQNDEASTNGPTRRAPLVVPSASDSNGDEREQTPPVATGQTLNARQITYCLSESIRLEAARSVATSDAAVDRFNSMVDDYNGRCASYKYSPQVFDAVQRQVEADRPRLEREGAARFGRYEAVR